MQGLSSEAQKQHLGSFLTLKEQSLHYVETLKSTQLEKTANVKKVL